MLIQSCIFNQTTYVYIVIPTPNMMKYIYLTVKLMLQEWQPNGPLTGMQFETSTNTWHHKHKRIPVKLLLYPEAIGYITITYTCNKIAHYYCS